MTTTRPTTDDTATCPSAPAVASSRLLGIVGPGGRVVYTPGGPRLTETLRSGLDADGRLETRYRFSGACVTSGCAFWQEGECAAVTVAHREYDAVAGADGPLPECGIRDSCRWWAQEGRAACAVCPFVVTASR
ncbi:hypothetical protein [Phytomonospora endophytica]|uniref:Uncharacterized protein n=1 Tax=Phytomonospora endophytica TaxID=714109 RepID=A0A841FQQ4_9ACTN|nr:hypothetical protein [Phytomonospora endophytica]MBB6034889.1 hypothetical protein [Phytomonospora endophytica]GIG70593.1 hypothetical protein Pen01_68880 [Phytomonospora endophytica]